jgi:CMP-N-acetylneuraminic acid synthetase
MKTYAFVFARGGTKGVPGKNIRPLVGKPLLAYSIQMAQSIDRIDDVFVSSDDERIQKIALQYGAKVVERPSELAKDDSPEWLAWQHAIESVQASAGPFDRMISLPTTAPLRNKDDVENCLDALEKDVDFVITASESERSPWFNMVKLDEFGNASLLLGDDKSIKRRQDAPESYDMTTVAYVSRPDFVMRSNAAFDGIVRVVNIPKERALDIDTEFDFFVAECLVEKLKEKNG